MKIKKMLCLSTMALTAVVGLASCGNAAKEDLFIPEMMELSELKAKYNSTSPIEINFWTGFGKDITDGLALILDEFQVEYPFIKVKHESKGGYTGLQKAVNLAISNAKYPQVVLGYPDHFAGYLSSGIQSGLDNYIDNANAEIKIDIDDFNQDFLRENKELAFKEDGTPHIVGLPFNKSTEVMVYNKTLFDVLGETVPETWDDAVAVSNSMLTKMKAVYGKKIYVFGDPEVIAYVDASGAKTPAGDPVTVPANEDPDLDLSGVLEKDFYPMAYDSQANFFITASKQWGGEYTVAGETISKGYIKFKNDKTKEALTFFKAMNTNKQLGIPYTWEEESYCSVPFKAGKAAMTISSSAGLSYNLASGMAFEAGIAPIPYKSVDKKAVISQGTNLAMLKSNKEKSLASWLLIKYLCTTGNPEFAIKTGYLPVTASGEASEAYQEFLNLDPDLSTAADKARIAAAKVANDIYGATGENRWSRFVDPAFRGSSTIRAEIEAAIPMVFYGDNGAAKTIDEVFNYLYTKLSLYVHADDK